jgi:hypothetical protein
MRERPRQISVKIMKLEKLFRPFRPFRPFRIYILRIDARFLFEADKSVRSRIANTRLKSRASGGVTLRGRRCSIAISLPFSERFARLARRFSRMQNF